MHCAIIVGEVRISEHAHFICSSFLEFVDSGPAYKSFSFSFPAVVLTMLLFWHGELAREGIQVQSVWGFMVDHLSLWLFSLVTSSTDNGTLVMPCRMFNQTGVRVKFGQCDCGIFVKYLSIPENQQL